MKNRDLLQTGIHELNGMPTQVNTAAHAIPVSTTTGETSLSSPVNSTRLPLLNKLSSQVPSDHGPLSDDCIARGTTGSFNASESDHQASTSLLKSLLVSILSYVAAALLFALMTLGCADVIGRYFLGKPITGGLEVTELLLAAMIFVGLPMVSIERAHVGLEILDSIASPWLTRILHWLSNLVSGAALMYLSWMLLQRAENLYSAGETTAILQLPLYPIAYLMSACVALAALITLALAWQPALQPTAQKDKEND